MTETTKVRKTPAKPRKTVAKAKPAAATNGHTAISQDEIARLAHKYWAERGHKHGHAEEDWLRAEQELRGRAS
jgi:hypothetical protein